MRRGLRSTYLLLGAAAAVAAGLAVSRLVPMSGLHREGRPPPAAATVPLSAPSPAPAPPVAPQAQPMPPAPEPMVAAAAPAPIVVPPAPPEPFVVDRRAVARVQFYLDRLGYQVGAADGVMGRRTRTAIAAFRAVSGLAKGEEVDGPLIDALDLAVSQLPKGKPAEGVPAAAPRVPVVSAPLSD